MQSGTHMVPALKAHTWWLCFRRKLFGAGSPAQGVDSSMRRLVSV